MGREKREILKDADDSKDRIDRLFSEAFLKSEQHFNSVTLCGWKPIDEVYQNKDTSGSGWESINGFALRAGLSTHETEPAVKIFETSMSTVIELDLPELVKESIRIDVRNHILMLSGHQHSSTEKLNGEFSIRNDYHKTFQKYITLPKTIAPGQITAKFKSDGIKIIIKKNDD